MVSSNSSSSSLCVAGRKKAVRMGRCRNEQVQQVKQHMLVCVARPERAALAAGAQSLSPSIVRARLPPCRLAAARS
jgi:hypothetical protein